MEMTMEDEIIIENEETKPQIDFNVFVGAETGLVKGISINPKMNLAKNFSNMQTLERKHEITSMSWGDSEQKEILLGLKGETVRTFDTEDKSFTSSREVKGGKVVGITRFSDSLVTASENGIVQVWSDPKKDFNTIEYELSCSGKLKADTFKDEEAKEKHLVSLKAERSLARMRKVANTSSLICTGGKENDLQIWDLNKTEAGPIFRGKNVPPDNLQLRVPIWVTDFCFPDKKSKDQIVTISRHGFIRLYDTRNQQRRPIMSLDWPDEVLTAISSTPCDHEILVGTASGHIAQYDIRMNHKGMRRKYRGCTGGVRSIDCHPVHNCFAAVGLDRFLRIYDVNQPKPIQKMYLKSKLNHVLMSKDFDPNEAIAKNEEKKKVKPKKKKEVVEVKGDGDEFWAKLPVVKSVGKGSKRLKVTKSNELLSKKSKK